MDTTVRTEASPVVLMTGATSDLHLRALRLFVAGGLVAPSALGEVMPEAA
jgi:hypothetical protein